MKDIILYIENNIEEVNFEDDYYNDDPAIGYGEGFCYEEEIQKEEE